MSEQIGLNYRGILDNQQKIGELEDRIKDLKKRVFSLEGDIAVILGGTAELSKRLHALEEKERARARDEHARDVSE